METIFFSKKTYEIFFVVEIALRAISTTLGRVLDGWTAVDGRDFAWRSCFMIIRVVGSRGLPQMVEIVTYSEVRRARSKR